MDFCLTKNDAVNDKSDDEEDKTLDADDDEKHLKKYPSPTMPDYRKNVGF